MGKKRHRFTWPEAKKRCRLNQHDIEMAKRLGFGPDALVHAIPDPKQKWKLPVKYWIHELHFKKFGHIPGEKEFFCDPPAPLSPEDQAEEARRFEEEMYWEDYCDRNADDRKDKRQDVAAKPAPLPVSPPVDDRECLIPRDQDDDLDTPF